ncbi:MAG TPA: TetR/AcrR family transcriptional regulator [Rhizomicrobium sp.]|jgi:AcrR family transcriptional regulator|nr:TetR/AcrR family transcriptional regulator [Rhizomicrobium sp.]
MSSGLRKLVFKPKQCSMGARGSNLTFAIHEAGRRLLAQHDCDDECVSVVKITKDAGVSIGTFYSRFRSKDVFIHALTYTTFRGATESADQALSEDHLGDASAEDVVRAIARTVVRQMGEPKTAGVLRAALKLAPHVSDILRPVRDYRALVTDRARSLLGGRKKAKPSSREIEAAIQMLFGTVVDAVVEQPGPLRAGSDGMADALGDIVVSYLGIASERAWSPKKDESERQDDQKAEGEKETVPNDEEAPALSDGYVPIIDPDLRKTTGAIRLVRRPSLRKTSGKSPRSARQRSSPHQSLRRRRSPLKGRKRKFTNV